jgi:very-short-patch-repair endonuclease
MIERRIESGRLIPVHPGIYLVGHRAVAPRAYETAAILACRPHALLSHPTATRLWKLPAADDGRVIHVTVVGRRRRSLETVNVHSIGHLAQAELRWIDGLPVTSPSMTILDVAGDGDEDELFECLHEARVHRLLTDADLNATLAAHPTRRGAKALRHLLATEGGVRITRSRAERRTLRVLRAHGLEPDASDVAVGPYTLDFFFRAERVAVEYDSRQFHDNERRFVGDRRKIAYLAARGILTVPLTGHDLGAGAEQAMADLKATLASRRSSA